MRGKNTIFINGQHYDAITGLAVGTPLTPTASGAKPAQATKVISDFGPATKAKPTAHTPRQTTHVKQIHAKPQRSQTLRRDILKRPVGTHEATKRTSVAPGAVAKSPAISRFASHPIPRPVTAPAQEKITLGPRKPVTIAPAVVKKAHETVDHHKAIQNKKTPAISSRELKEQLIAERLASVDTHKKAPKVKGTRGALQSRTATVISASLALVVLGGYLTYLNMPNLSVRVAAAQAGVNASFPEYRPDGYRFNGPIAYAPGEVSMKFQSNSGTQGYEIKQKSSSWDSQAVLDNYVTRQSDSYLTYSEQGLTVYTFGSEAAWVNGGVLYTLEGDAPLSNEQVLRIASSM